MKDYRSYYYAARGEALGELEGPFTYVRRSNSVVMLNNEHGSTFFMTALNVTVDGPALHRSLLQPCKRMYLLRMLSSGSMELAAELDGVTADGTDGGGLKRNGHYQTGGCGI
ncbi:hypothetical protein CRENBAI_025066 [Crenichthys baileyi]|uniref:Uncharacterized protein n=1 Tax=Crenichthys baileyi TaxID=28760 RepID=A0AAV9R1W7_9TELE